MHYRIQFATPTVRPEVLPGFTYVATIIMFDYVLYTAILVAESDEGAMAAIRRSWPSAEVRYVEPGVPTFRFEDEIRGGKYYGTAPVSIKRHWWGRRYLPRWMRK